MDNLIESKEKFLDLENHIDFFDDHTPTNDIEQKVQVSDLGSFNTSTTSQNYFSFELNKTKDGYIISALDKKDLPSNLIIPGEYDGKPITHIKHNGFSQCTSLIRVLIPNSVILIESTKDCGVHGAFSECTNLSIVEFQEGSILQSIGSYAFSKCSRLESIIIPETVKAINSFAFNACSNLQQIYFLSEPPPRLGNNLFNSLSKSLQLYVPKTSLRIYKCNYTWRAYSKIINILPSNIPLSLGYFNFELNEDKESYTISEKSISLLPPNLILPSYYNKLPVTIIKSYSFVNIPNLTTLVLPKNLSIIDSSAFRISSYTLQSFLKEINIPNSVVKIGDYAFFSGSYFQTSPGFYDSPSVLETVIFDSNSQLETVGDGAFSFNTKLTNITFPTSLREILSAFSDCSRLPIINIPSQTQSISDYSFLHSTSVIAINVDISNKYYKSIDGILFDCDMKTLIKFPPNKVIDTYTIPNTVVDIPHFSFEYNRHLKIVNLPEGVINIEGGAFYYCTQLEEVNIPGTVENIGVTQFKNCNRLLSLNVSDMNRFYTTIDDALLDISLSNLIAYPACSPRTNYVTPSSIKIINDSLFCDCKYLENIVISEGVTKIGQSVLNNCASLKKISLPSSLESIDFNSLVSCPKLQSISVHDDNTVFKSFDGVLIDTSLGQLIVYPAAKPNSYYLTPPIATTINSYAFKGAKNLINLEIAEGTNIIDGDSFYDCSFLKTIKIPSSVTKIGLIYNCPNLEYFHVHNDNVNYKSENGILFTKDGLKLIAYPVKKLNTTYTTPYELNTLGSYAFYESKNLESIVITEKVTIIGSYTFFNCKNLKEIIILGQVTNIGYAAFLQCNNIKTFTIYSVTPPSLYYYYCNALPPVSDKLKIFVPKASLELYKTAPRWNVYANNIFPI